MGQSSLLCKVHLLKTSLSDLVCHGTVSVAQSSFA